MSACRGTPAAGALTCDSHVTILSYMSVMIQIRNVPDPLHRSLKARAAFAGMSLSDFLLAELRRSLERPTRAELLERLAQRAPVKARPSPAAVIRRERDRR